MDSKLSARDVRERLIESLRMLRRNQEKGPEGKPAAVLVILYPKNEQPTILFTKRSDRVSEHKGQVSFPGGVHEDADMSLFHTAQRETREELGFEARDFELLGELDEVFTFRSKFVITPFVVYTSSLPGITPNPTEIMEVLEIPLSTLADQMRFSEESHIVGGVQRPIYSYRFPGNTIWGATARIVRQLLELLLD